MNIPLKKTDAQMTGTQSDRQVEERKRHLALQALILKIKDLIDDYLAVNYPDLKG